MRVLALVKVSSLYCERMDDSLLLTCSFNERTLYTADPPSPFNRLFLVDANANTNILQSFRENRFPTAWTIWNRDANFDGWLPFVEDLLQRDFYRNYFKPYDFIVKVDDDIMIRTNDWVRTLADRMNALGSNCVSLGAAAFTSSNLVIANNSKLVMYRSDYILGSGPIKLEPTFIHPNVFCEVLSGNGMTDIVAPLSRQQLGRVLIGGITNVVP